MEQILNLAKAIKVTKISKGFRIDILKLVTSKTEFQENGEPLQEYKYVFLGFYGESISGLTAGIERAIISLSLETQKEYLLKDLLGVFQQISISLEALEMDLLHLELQKEIDS